MTSGINRRHLEEARQLEERWQRITDLEFSSFSGSLPANFVAMMRLCKEKINLEQEKINWKEEGF